MISSKMINCTFFVIATTSCFAFVSAGTCVWNCKAGYPAEFAWYNGGGGVPAGLHCMNYPNLRSGMVYTDTGVPGPSGTQTLVDWETFPEEQCVASCSITGEPLHQQEAVCNVPPQAPIFYGSTRYSYECGNGS